MDGAYLATGDAVSATGCDTEHARGVEKASLREAVFQKDVLESPRGPLTSAPFKFSLT